MHYGAFDLPKRICGSGVKDYQALLPVFYRMYQMDEKTGK